MYLSKWQSTHGRVLMGRPVALTLRPKYSNQQAKSGSWSQPVTQIYYMKSKVWRCLFAHSSSHCLLRNVESTISNVTRQGQPTVPDSEATSCFAQREAESGEAEWEPERLSREQRSAWPAWLGPDSGSGLASTQNLEQTS